MNSHKLEKTREKERGKKIFEKNKVASKTSLPRAIPKERGGANGATRES